MIYKSFNIENFKGIRDLSINLQRKPASRIFSLVGLNESGKTTILEALDWFYDCSSYDPHDLIPKSELLNFNGKISVSAKLLFHESDNTALIEFMKKTHKYNIHRIEDEFEVKNVFEYEDSSCVSKSTEWNVSIIGKTSRMKEAKALSDSESYWDSAVDFIKDSLLPPIIYYPNFLFDFPDKIYLEFITEEDDKISQIYRDVIQDVLNSMQKKLDIEKHLLDRYKSGKQHDRASMASVLQKLSSRIETDVFSIWKDLLKIDRSGLQLTFGQSIEEDEKGLFLQVKVKEGDQDYFIRERSLGFRWFFSFILFTHFRAFRDVHFKNAVFLLDEPASNLHPTAQTKLLKALENYTSNQSIIYTTHSHHMINPKWLSGTFVVKNDAKDYKELDIKYNSYMTNITAVRYFQFVSKNPNDKDFYRPILDALDFQPSLLENVPDIVILEGKNDYYTLKYLNDNYFENEEFENNLYPSTGKDKTDYIISLYLAWGRNFIVLLDDDRGGRNTYNRLIDEYGVDVEGKVFKLSNIDPKFKSIAMEDVFVEGDKIKIQKTIYPDKDKYNKSSFNTAIVDCYINETKIKLTKFTIDRFRKVFKFINENIKN